MPLLVYQFGSAMQVDCRSHVKLVLPQKLSVSAGWRLIGSSRESA
jgi:hypothetical protein